MEAGTADLDLSTDAGTIGRASGKRGAGRTLSLDLKGGASLACTPRPNRLVAGC